MKKILDNYLEKMEKCLRPVPVSERIDIINEIKSEMQELLRGSFLFSTVKR